jgi:hypothetical protein
MDGRPVQGPSGRVDVGATTTSEPIANVGAVVAGLRAGFRSCFNAGLNVDPSMSGHVTLVVKVAPSGEVSSAQPENNVGLSDGVLQCLVQRVRNAQFDSPGPKGSTLRVPLKFTLGEK